MKNTCIEVSILGIKLHKLFLDIIKVELDILNTTDINSIQVLTLISVGDSTVTIGELISKGHYMGSNASYNVKKMVDNGYLIQTPSKRDKRASYVKLSTKGKNLFETLKNGLSKYTTVFEQTKENHLKDCIENIKKINLSWKSILSS
ncbi:MAG: MarR family transcriptional regulator [Holosporales bacterium]|jgi:DNA-binding MarR family transcriptional regulator|nr:MarR family transcriptional regulator [Holosporales bacterium]